MHALRPVAAPSRVLGGGGPASAHRRFGVRSHSGFEVGRLSVCCEQARTVDIGPRICSLLWISLWKLWITHLCAVTHITEPSRMWGRARKTNRSFEFAESYPYQRLGTVCPVGALLPSLCIPGSGEA